VIGPEIQLPSEALAVGSAGAASTNVQEAGIVRAPRARPDNLFKECLEIADRGSESENENPPTHSARPIAQRYSNGWHQARAEKYGGPQ